MGRENVFSVFGQITDFNIWGKAFTDEEVAKWMNCKMQEEGDLLGWSKATWKMFNVFSDIADKDDVCAMHKKIHLFGSLKKKDLQGTVEICEKVLGGKIAVGEDVNKLQNMVEIIEMLDKNTCGNNFYTGFTDEKEEGTYRNVITDEVMQWAPWQHSQPNNIGNEDCADYRIDNGKVYDISCQVNYCPICEIMDHVVFELSGFYTLRDLDRFYLFRNSLEFYGYGQTKMLFEKEDRKWRIIEQVHGKTLVELNKSDPIGRNEWFLPENGSLDLNLHLKVDMPGKFCCNNGLCIISELRCDGKQDCDDHSDEDECNIIIFPSHDYDKEQPPTQKEQVYMQLIRYLKKNKAKRT